ncbi:hypothetical protein Tcan_07738 [Toxocara canis]|uniref:Uncharacterized protein n=1 Tax=Toxocara canis TaxID=6265 RepID=A0A0B2UPG4_TOXCA|nr:hypothetical protein Tcan_07738 [Toxocara canis]
MSPAGRPSGSDGKIRCNVYMAFLECSELRIAADGEIASCIDGENDEIDEIIAVLGIHAVRVNESKTHLEMSTTGSIVLKNVR